MIYYALKRKMHAANFMCVSTTEKGLDSMIQTAYNNKRGLMPRGHKYTMGDFMLDKVRVKITVEEL